jgi:hypothetical protein
MAATTQRKNAQAPANSSPEERLVAGLIELMEARLDPNNVLYGVSPLVPYKTFC